MEYAREYRQLTNRELPADATVLDIISDGLPLDAIENIASIFDIKKSQAAPLLGISLRAVQARKQRNTMKTLRMHESDRAFQLVKLMNEPVKYFGSIGVATRWMKTPNKALGNKVPLELCTTGLGIQMIRDSINRLNCGFTA